MSDEILTADMDCSDNVVSMAVSRDTPINRATLNQLTVVELETQLDALRARRLVIREKIERAAKVKTEKADLSAYLKFEKLLKTVKKELTKLDADYEKLEGKTHKLRALVIEMGVE